MDIGRGIRVLRAAANLTQRELAERAGLDPSYLSLIESGQRKPSEKTVVSIANALGVRYILIHFAAAEIADIQPRVFDNMARELALFIIKQRPS